jgi:antirestriction protein ArdC
MRHVPGPLQAPPRFEELVAEIGSAFIGMELNIPTSLENHASYIDHWLSMLREDKRAIFRAAAQAQKAVDFILSFHPDYASTLSQSHDGSLRCG